MSRSTTISTLLPGLLPLTFLLSLSGCATIGDMADKQKIYGGTRFIAEQVEQPCILGPCSSCGPCWLFDLPLSIAADTALLPVTVTLAIVRSSQKESDPNER